MKNGSAQLKRVTAFWVFLFGNSFILYFQFYSLSRLFFLRSLSDAAKTDITDRVQQKAAEGKAIGPCWLAITIVCFVLHFVPSLLFFHFLFCAFKNRKKTLSIRDYHLVIYYVPRCWQEYPRSPPLLCVHQYISPMRQPVYILYSTVRVVQYSTLYCTALVWWWIYGIKRVLPYIILIFLL